MWGFATIGADFLNGLIELSLAAAGDEDISAFLNETLCGREADAAATPG